VRSPVQADLVAHDRSVRNDLEVIDRNRRSQEPAVVQLAALAIERDLRAGSRPSTLNPSSGPLVAIVRPAFERRQPPVEPLLRIRAAAILPLHTRGLSPTGPRSEA